MNRSVDPPRLGLICPAHPLMCSTAPNIEIKGLVNTSNLSCGAECIAKRVIKKYLFHEMFSILVPCDPPVSTALKLSHLPGFKLNDCFLRCCLNQLWCSEPTLGTFCHGKGSTVTQSLRKKLQDCIIWHLSLRNTVTLFSIRATVSHLWTTQTSLRSVDLC